MSSHDLAGAIPAVAFWIFIAVVVVAGVAGGAFRHLETQKTIRQAIQAGQTLDPETLDRLLRSSRGPSGPPSRSGYWVGGILMLSIGAGIAMIGWATSQTNPSDLYPGLGAGAMVGMIGVGLLAAGLAVGGRHKNGQG
jgi:hypothetical protein